MMTATRKAAAKSQARKESATERWARLVVEQAAECRQIDRYQPLTLTSAYELARAIDPALTLGGFHDGLRDLRDAGRIRLIPWTRSFALIPDSRNALYLDGEVMYYIEPV